jgi:hypothetical protein
MPLLGFHPSTSSVFGATFEDLRKQRCEAQVPRTLRGEGTGSRPAGAHQTGVKNPIAMAISINPPNA